MQLKPDQANLIINNLVCKTSELDRDTNRRRADHRYPLHSQLRLLTQPQPDVEPRFLCDAWAIDLSNSGLSMIVPRAFSVGRALLLDLSRVTDPPVALHALVRSQRRVFRNAYCIGVELLFDYGAIRMGVTEAGQAQEAAGVQQATEVPIPDPA